MGRESVAGEALLALDLPTAPPVTRVAAAPVSRPRLPAVLLIVLGAVLVLGPIIGGLFSKVAAGKQMIDRFAPHMTQDALARYSGDVATIRSGAAGVKAVYASQDVSPARFPGLDQLNAQAGAITDRADALLDRVAAARPDYDKVSEIGGFDRVPFLIVISGAVAIYAGCVLRFGGRRRAKGTALLVSAVSAVVALYPFVSGFGDGASAGHRMLRDLSPVMTAGQVSQLQDDFIVLVTAVGELDTSFAAVPRSGQPAAQIHGLVEQWPAVSSDLATLVGTINDNITNFNALKSLDGLAGGDDASGLEAFPWALVGIGAVSALLSVAALPRRTKENA